jgi:hypothetical protein
MIFENMMLRNIFGSNRNEYLMEWRASCVMGRLLFVVNG